MHKLLTKRANSKYLFQILKLIGLIVFGITLSQNSAKAQSRSERIPRIEKPPLEPVEPKTPIPPPDFSIPKQEPSIENIQDIYVKDFEFIDNTVFSSETLKKQISSFRNKNITAAERQEIVKILTNYYTERGYKNSFADILVQDNTEIKDDIGIIKIRIIEGRIGTSTIHGTKRLKRYISDRIDKKGVFNVKRFTNQLINLQNDPLIDKIEIDFTQGDDINVLNYDVSVKPSKSYKFNLSLNNYGSESSGTLQTSINLSLLNPTTFGDKLNLSYRNSSGSNQFSANYQIPFTKDNSAITIGYSTSANTNIEPPFNQFNIKDSFHNYYLEVSHYLHNRTTSLYHLDYGIKLGIDYLNNQSSLLGFNFPTLRGSDNSGLISVSFIRFTQNLQFEDPVQALSIKSVLSQEIDLNSHTATGFSHDSFYWTGDYYYQRSLTKNLTFITKGGLQISSSPLPNIVQYGLGGFYTVRGYQLNESATDNGAFSSIEFRALIYNKNLSKIFVTPFFDVGYGWNVSFGNQTPLLLGTGIIFDYKYSDLINAKIGVGIPIFDQVSKGFQDTRLIFNLNFIF